MFSLNILNFRPATMGVRTLCLFIQSLLSNPDMDYPIANPAGLQLKSFPNIYVRTAKYWAVVYAGKCDLLSTHKF